jgi:hypothetical protein
MFRANKTLSQQEIIGMPTVGIKPQPIDKNNDNIFT